MAINFDNVQFKEGFGSALSFLLGDIDNVGSAAVELLMIKLLVLILVIVLTKFSLEKGPFGFSDNKMVLNIISISVGLMAVRWLTQEELINFIWLPYGVLGVALATLLPFIIFFIFIESFEEAILRRVAWIAYMVIYGALAYLRWPDFQTADFNLAWLYVLVAGLSLLSFLFDKSIRYHLYMNMIKKGENVGNAVLATNLERELSRINESLGYIDLHGGDTRRKATLSTEKQRLTEALARAKRR